MKLLLNCSFQAFAVKSEFCITYILFLFSVWDIFLNKIKYWSYSRQLQFTQRECHICMQFCFTLQPPFFFCFAPPFLFQNSWWNTFVSICHILFQGMIIVRLKTRSITHPGTIFLKNVPYSRSPGTCRS